MTEQRSRLRILATLDGSEQAETALRFARTIAAGQADITVLRVISDRETIFDPSGLLVMPEGEEIATQLDRAEVQSRASISKFDDAPGVIWEVVALVGDPAETILNTAATLHVDMIIMSSTGKGAFTRLAVGSVADRVSRTATVPVVVVHAGEEAVVTRVLAPIDGSERAANELPAALNLARRLGTPIEFIYVVDYSKFATGLGAYAPEAQSQMIIEAKAVGQRFIDDAIEQTIGAGVDAHGSVFTGIPAQVILDEAKRGDMIVMCSHGRSGISRWLIGSVAEKIIHVGATPVMLVPARALAHVEPAKAAV